MRLAPAYAWLALNLVGCHLLAAELTLVRDGRPEAVILVSAEVNESAWFAAGELVDHVQRITGAKLPILTDKETGEPPTGTRILVGESKWTRDAELSNKSFAEQEYLIRFTPDSIILMGRDDMGTNVLKSTAFTTNVIPENFRLQGTSYAMHDFLEKHCGVRWYAPGLVGMEFPTQATLTVTGSELRRRPWLDYRGGHGLTSWGMAPLATNRQMALHYARLKRGGKWYAVSHSFEVYPDRFHKKNPGNPKIWEGEHPEYFAKDVDGYPQPYQMCYSSTALVAQVVKDATAFFAGKRVPGADGGQDYFSVVPRDNDAMCLCKKCKAATGKRNGYFSNGQASKLVWKFTIAVANKFTNQLPGKFVGQLAYRNYALYPTGLKIPTNVLVGLCIWDGERLWSEEPSRYELNNYKTWVSKTTPAQRTSMWLYQCFPMESAGSGGFNCFLGFYGDVLERQMRLFAKDGIRGINLCGTAEYIDGYLTHKLMDDPSLSVDAMLGEFFSSYYGPASNEMAQIYRRIEDTYTDLQRYPNKRVGMNEVVAWKHLGDAKVMGDLRHLMTKAQAALGTESNRYVQRVQLFDRDILSYMEKGRERYVMKVKYKTHAEATRKKKPPKAQAVMLKMGPSSGAGPDKIDWSKVPKVELKYSADGYPADRPASFQAAHDGQTLFLRMNEQTDTTRVEPGGLWWAGDHWFVFMTRAEKGAYRYFRVPFQSAADATVVYPDEKPPVSASWATKLRVAQAVTTNEWSVMAAIPFVVLDEEHPVKAGTRLYFNVIRNSFGGDSHLAWAPTFEAGYYSRTRAGMLTLMSR